MCFRHDDSHEPPDAVHLTGCRGAYGVLNGLYQRVDGVSASTRPIFAKDGMSVGSSSEDERHILGACGRPAPGWSCEKAEDGVGQKQVGIVQMGS